MSESQSWPPIAGLRVVVTGGSSGIGRATCLLLGSLGAQVGVHYRESLTEAEAVVDEIQSTGGRAFLIQGDLRLPEDRELMISKAWQKLEHIDAWIHNAGADVLTGGDAVLEFQEKLALLWQVDVEGTIQLARAVADRMRQQQPTDVKPSMVFIGWDQAIQGMEGEAGQMFGPIKSAVMSYSMNLAQSLAPWIRVNCVAPGWIKTAWGEQTNESWNRRAHSSSLMNRWGTPQDVANAIVFLSSPASSFVNGQILEVNGGWNRKLSS